MKKISALLLLFCWHTTTFASSSTHERVETTCMIYSPANPNLAVDINRDTLCGSVIDTLKKYKNYDDRDQVKLTVLSQAMYSVSMSYSFYSGRQKIDGKGIVYWNPDEAYFVLDDSSVADGR